MTQLSDYQRLVEKPAIASYEATIKDLRGRLEREICTRRSLEKLISFEVDGACPICVGVEGCSHSLGERYRAATPTASVASAGDRITINQLRASAVIQDVQTKRETGWADTSHRAELMRKAADTIERLATLSAPSAEVREALEESASLFRRYAKEHRHKLEGKAGGSLAFREQLAKCRTNEIIARKIEAFLALLSSKDGEAGK